MDNQTMGPADFAAMSGNGFSMETIVILILIFMMGGWGNGLGRGNYATNDAVQQGFDNQNMMANQRELLSATNQTFHDTLGVIQNTYNELQRDIAGVAVTQQQAIANQNECCCGTKLLITETAAGLNAAIAQNRYDAAMNTANIIQAVQAEGNATRQMYQQYRYDDLLQKYNALDQRMNTQELRNDINAATADVVRYPNGFAYNAGPSPFCGCGGYNI